ncbi:MAG: SsrA-binding protein SmpB [Erysipelotrichaceae bacterium]|nr:SsrA-binding protein SmpB [Erysipelotrichaceae bacterium]
MKIISNNKKAYHDYFILDTFEAGIELKGTEIKSVRLGNVNLKDSYVRIKNNEVEIVNMHISPYEMGNIFNHEPTRTRKLLLHRKEIKKIETKLKEGGLTVVATKMYFGDSPKAKLEIGIAKGKKLYDKREDLKARDAKREIEKALKNY